MLTFQDWLKAENKEAFILDGINKYTASQPYLKALEAREYYARRNVEIMRRRGALLTTGELSKLHKKAVRPANKKCCGFFQKSVNQLAMYLLGNGAALLDAQKGRLGPDFDTVLQKIGRQALIDGVCWGYYSGDRVTAFTASEFFAFPDERTSAYMVGVRFYQIDPEKPMYVELYEVDGVTVYLRPSEGASLVIAEPKKPYIQEFVDYGGQAEITGSRNFNALPVVPFWAKDDREGALTESLKNDIDLYDRVMSDFGDNLDRANDIYYIVQNYGGANLKQLIDEIEEYKAIYVDGDAGASIHTLEVPHEARRTALELLERQMYKETQTLNTEELSGGSLTNVAIKVALTDLDLKTDMFQWEAEAFVRGLLSLFDAGDAEIEFKRRSLVNDTETIDNIYKMREDIDLETALELNPLIPEDRIKEVLGRVDAENMKRLYDEMKAADEPDGQRT
jgi:hypothetical protein